MPFWGIAGVASLLFLNYIALPNSAGGQNAPHEAPSLKSQLKLATNPKIWLMSATTILGYGGTFAAFTYLSPILQEITKIDAKFISIVLVVYGVMIAIGNSYGGKIGDKNPLKALGFVFIIQAAVLFAFYWTQNYKVLSLVTIVFMGLLAFMSVPALQLLMIKLANKYAPEAQDLASSLNISSFNGGITLGAVVGGLAISYVGLSYTALVATLMTFLGLVLSIALSKIEKF